MIEGGAGIRTRDEAGEPAATLRQRWGVPADPRPIAVVGAGAIVRSAHLPAYRRLGLPVAGLFDVDRRTAVATAALHDVPVVFETLEAACRAAAAAGAVFDLAVPGSEIVPVLEKLPAGSPVLIQKPMGETLREAREIVRICRERRLIAAVNFQLRFSPGMLAIQDALGRGIFGAITDIEVRLQVRQPWENWAFVRKAPRVEVLYHSIHYLDAIRRLAGEPSGVYCRAVPHPQLPDVGDSRSTIILDYGGDVRCSLALNHTHRFGRSHRASMFKVEGTAGAAILTLGVNLEYPAGPPDTLEIATGDSWTAVPLRGSWFPEAFEGPMCNLQRFVSGEDDALVSPVADALHTMAVVEACYVSSASGGTPVPRA